MEECFMFQWAPPPPFLPHYGKPWSKFWARVGDPPPSPLILQ